jgi:hypothetical protein
LVLFRLKSKGIHIDTSGGDVGVALVRLDKVKVRSKTLGETIVTVELKLGTNDGVTTSALGSKTGVVSTTGSLVVIGEVDGGVVVGSRTTTLGKLADTDFGGSLPSLTLGTVDLVDELGREADSGITGLDVGTKSGIGVKKTVGLNLAVSIVVEVISVVVPLVHAELNNRVTLDNPDEFLNGVVKVQFNLNILRSNRLIARELELLNKILMRDLRETPSFISIKVDVIYIKRSSLKRGDAEEGIRLGVDVDSAVSERIGSDVALVLLTELKNNFDLVVLHLKYPTFRCIYIQKPRFNTSVRFREWTIS